MSRLPSKMRLFSPMIQVRAIKVGPELGNLWTRSKKKGKIFRTEREEGEEKVKEAGTLSKHR